MTNKATVVAAFSLFVGVVIVIASIGLAQTVWSASGPPGTRQSPSCSEYRTWNDRMRLGRLDCMDSQREIRLVDAPISRGLLYFDGAPIAKLVDYFGRPRRRPHLFSNWNSKHRRKSTSKESDEAQPKRPDALRLISLPFFTPTNLLATDH